ncbi:MAG: hypothetical protein AAGG75_24420 [Bacteroidota bacterium]
MSQSTIEQTKVALEAYYEQMRQHLLRRKNYLYSADLTNIKRYLVFLESSLQQPYNRIAHLAAFIHDEDGLMSSRMYPLTFLLPDTKLKIYQCYQEVEQLVDAAEIEDQLSYLSFEKEPHIE